MQRAQSTFDDDSVGCHEKHPVTERTQNIYTSKINLWFGQPPKWVEMFTVSSCLLLNVVADLYVKSGRNCSLSSILQSLLSSCSPIFDWISEGWDEALPSLCELIIQYIALKIETDIEELYICFRLLKRYLPFITSPMLTINLIFFLIFILINLVHVIISHGPLSFGFFQFV